MNTNPNSDSNEVDYGYLSFGGLSSTTGLGVNSLEGYCLFPSLGYLYLVSGSSNGALATSSQSIQLSSTSNTGNFPKLLNAATANGQPDQRAYAACSSTAGPFFFMIGGWNSTQVLNSGYRLIM